jgi:hypothetical protein
LGLSARGRRLLCTQYKGQAVNLPGPPDKSGRGPALPCETPRLPPGLLPLQSLLFNVHPCFEPAPGPSGKPPRARRPSAQQRPRAHAPRPSRPPPRSRSEDGLRRVGGSMNKVPAFAWAQIVAAPRPHNRCRNSSALGPRRAACHAVAPAGSDACWAAPTQLPCRAVPAAVDAEPAASTCTATRRPSCPPPSPPSKRPPWHRLSRWTRSKSSAS